MQTSGVMHHADQWCSVRNSDRLSVVRECPSPGGTADWTVGVEVGEDQAIVCHPLDVGSEGGGVAVGREVPKTHLWVCVCVWSGEGVCGCVCGSVWGGEGVCVG